MNNKGSAIAWAVISLSVIVIIAAASLSSGAAYTLRSVKGNNRRQAYLTARSAVDAVLSRIDGYTVSGSPGTYFAYDNPLIPQTLGDSADVTGMSFPEDMGLCTAKVTRTAEDVLEITATATVETESRSVRARVERSVEMTSGGGEVSGVFKGIYAESLKMDANLTLRAVNATDLYIGGITGSQNKNSGISVGGILYTDLTVTDGKIGNMSVAYGGKGSFRELQLPRSVTLPGTCVNLNDNGGVRDIYLGSGESGFSYVLMKRPDGGAYGGAPDSNGVISDRTAIHVGGGRSYYIKTAPGATLNLDIVNDTEEASAVYVFLDGKNGSDEAALNVLSVDETIMLYICGGTGSVVNMSGGLELTGAVSADTLEVTDDFDMGFQAPPAGLAVYDDGEAAETHTWSFVRYEQG